MSSKAAEMIERARRLGKPPRLGCVLTAHRDLGSCAHCLDGHGEDPFLVELNLWRLLAAAERGIPDQPAR